MSVPIIIRIGSRLGAELKNPAAIDTSSSSSQPPENMYVASKILSHRSIRSLVAKEPKQDHGIGYCQSRLSVPNKGNHQPAHDADTCPSSLSRPLTRSEPNNNLPLFPPALPIRRSRISIPSPHFGSPFPSQRCLVCPLPVLFCCLHCQKIRQHAFVGQ